MALQETQGGNITIIDGGDIFDFYGSGAITEGRLVELNTTITDVNGNVGVVQQAGANSTAVLGYVEATYEANDRVRVRTGGIARLYNNTAGTITAGTLVGAGAAGTIVGYTGASGSVVGVALQNITTASFGRVFVRPNFNPNAGA